MTVEEYRRAVLCYPIVPIWYQSNGAMVRTSAYCVAMRVGPRGGHYMQLVRLRLSDRDLFNYAELSEPGHLQYIFEQLATREQVRYIGNPMSPIPQLRSRPARNEWNRSRHPIEEVTDF